MYLPTPERKIPRGGPRPLYGVCLKRLFVPLTEERIVNNLNVVLQPIDRLQQAVIALSRQAGEAAEAHFVLDGVSCHPHMTVYKATVADERIDAVLAAVTRLAARLTFCCDFLCVGSGRGYILLRFDRTPALMDLHTAVVGAINPLRNGHARVRTQYTLTAQQAANNRQYGHPRVLDTFEPHMTVTRLQKASDADRVAGLLTWSHFHFWPLALSVFRSGDHGTCRELIYAAPLQASS